MTAYRRPQAVVLTSDGVYYDTGHNHPVSARLNLDSLTAVLEGAAQLFRGREGVCVLSNDKATVLDHLKLTPMPDYWTFTELRPWTTFQRTDGTVIHLGLLKELGERPGGLLQGAQSAAEIAERLGRYAVLTGSHWRATAGVSACAGLRARYAERRTSAQPLWHHQQIKGMRATGPLVWRNPSQPDPTETGLVHVFDVNAMYLAALRNAQLAWGALELYRDGFDPNMPGWWEVDTARIPPSVYDGRTQPPAFPERLIHRGSVWLTTPVVKFLTELTGDTPDVHAGWVSSNPHPIARPYAERLMMARRGEYGELGPGMLNAIKRTYTELVGMMARQGGSIERADWAATVADLARVNMLRRVVRVSDIVPILAVQTDAVYLLGGSAAEHSAALGVGTAPGTFKYVESLTVPQYRAKLVTA